MPRPCRKKLPHEVPGWVAQGARHFITVNHEIRGTDALCRDRVPHAILDSGRVYEQIGRWFLWLLLVMPDHLHLIATFDLQRGLRPTMIDWKRYHASQTGVDWQDDWFEHRLRNEKEFLEKAHYVRMNPVRKSLVDAPEQWPYVTDCVHSSWQSPGT